MGHPGNNNFVINRLQLVAKCDKLVGNPLPHCNSVLNNVNMEERGIEDTIPPLSRDSVNMPEDAFFEFHDLFHPNARSVSMIAETNVFKRGKAMTAKSIVSIKKLPFGWNYIVNSQSIKNKRYSVKITWPTTISTNPNDCFEFDCSCPFSLENVTMCKHSVAVLLHIGKRK